MLFHLVYKLNIVQGLWPVRGVSRYRHKIFNSIRKWKLWIKIIFILNPKSADAFVLIIIDLLKESIFSKDLDYMTELDLETIVYTYDVTI